MVGMRNTASTQEMRLIGLSVEKRFDSNIKVSRLRRCVKFMGDTGRFGNVVPELFRLRSNTFSPITEFNNLYLFVHKELLFSQKILLELKTFIRRLKLKWQPFFKSFGVIIFSSLLDIFGTVPN